jgi:hypothetical protein
VRHDAGGDGQPELLGFAIEFPEENPGLRSSRTRRGIDPDPFHPGLIDDHAAIADRVAGKTVASPAHRGKQAVLSREAHCGNHIRNSGTTGDERRTPVDRAVPHPPVLLIRAIAGTNQLAPKDVAKSSTAPRSSGTRSPLNVVTVVMGGLSTPEWWLSGT